MLWHVASFGWESPSRRQVLPCAQLWCPAPQDEEGCHGCRDSRAPAGRGTIGNTSNSSFLSLPLCWGGPIAMLCLVQKITAHVGSNLTLHYLAVNHLPHDLTSIFFFLCESLSCKTGCRYAFVSFSHHLLLVGLVTHSAVWKQLVGLRGSKLKCPHTNAVHAVEWLVLFSVGDVL